MSRVLVVEDNVELALNVAEILESLAEVTVAHDADAAIREASHGDVDLAIVDVRLPEGRSGVELIPEIKARSPNVECVLVTGNATVDSAVAAVRHGAVAYVQKPFASRDLLAIASRALEQARLRRERERLALELARSEALHRSVLDSVETAIVGLGAGSELVFVNGFASRIVRAGAPDSLRGRRFEEVFAAARDREEARRAIARAASEATHDIELDVPRDDDTPCVLRWSFTPIARTDTIRVLAVGVDVTRTRELERRAADSEALAAVGALTTGLAHEIRNPLNAAILQLEALVRGARRVDDEAVRAKIDERVRIVRSELRRLTSMLDDFLGFARPTRVRLERTDLAALVDDVVALDRPLADEQGVTLAVAIDADARDVLADAPRITQVLINLVRNALEAMRGVGAGGTITVGARARQDGRVEVRVEDEGVGLDVPDEGIFRPFVTTKEAGTGLGLSIVKKIVELHGGEVALRPRSPCGAIATFSLARA